MSFDALVNNILREAIFKDPGIAEKDVDPKALAQGIEVEKEHTMDIEVAKTIALAHLKEDPLYYSKLAKIGL